MSTSISKKQLQANRKNGKESNGPKSGPGASRVTGNLLRPGLLAKEVVIKAGDGAERRAEFNALLAILCDDLRPKTVVDQILVERIATCYWRMRRALRYEIGTIREVLDDCLTGPDDADDESRRVEKRLRRAQESLTFEQDTLRALDTPPDLTDPETLDVLQPALDQLAADHGLPPLDPPPLDPGSLSPTPADRQDETTEPSDNHEPPSVVQTLQQAGLTGETLQNALRTAQSKVVDQSAAEVDHWCHELDTIRRKRDLHRNRGALAACLPDDDRLLRLVRYETMLDCQLHRALAELRRRRNNQRDPPDQQLKTDNRQLETDH